MKPPNNHFETDDEPEISSHLAPENPFTQIPLDLGSVTLDLTLGFSNDHNMNTVPIDQSNDINAPTLSEGEIQREFSCNYCKRKFYSSQALGGHQNAHKRERTLAKRAMQMGMLSNNRYANLASLPLHGSTYRSLGIEAHGSMHQGGLIHPGRSMFGVRGGARFDQNYNGAVPMFIEEDDYEPQLFWPGSVRHIDGVGVNIPEYDMRQKTNANPPTTRKDLSSPDLTLKL